MNNKRYKCLHLQMQFQVLPNSCCSFSPKSFLCLIRSILALLIQSYRTFFSIAMSYSNNALSCQIYKSLYMNSLSAMITTWTWWWTIQLLQRSRSMFQSNSSEILYTFSNLVALLDSFFSTIAKRCYLTYINGHESQLFK